MRDRRGFLTALLAAPLATLAALRSKRADDRLLADKWYHIAITRDQEKTVVYIDGEAILLDPPEGR